jgi:3-hydroxyisobutyrate dehydrogenase
VGFVSQRPAVGNALIARSFSVTSSNMNDVVGFVGLGNMGSHMAKNLLKKKFKVIVFDVNPQSVAALKESGATSVESPEELGSQTKTIVSMLPSSPNVYSVYAGKKGIFNTVQEGSLLLDCSTIDPDVSREMEKEAALKGATFMDCPVSGGVVAARDSLLTFMVGGKRFDDAQKILQHMGKNIINCGPVGTGGAAKICNNMLLAVSMIGTAEAMNLGLRLGLEPKLLAKIINSSSGRCWSSEVYNPCPGVVMGIPSANNYQGGFGSELMAKDLSFAQTAAANSSTPIPLGSVAHQMYRIMCNTGYARKDFSSVFQFLQQEHKDEKK